MRIARETEAPAPDQEGNLAAQYLAAKNAHDQAKRHLDQIQAQLVAQMQYDHQKSHAYVFGGQKTTITYVQNTRVEINEAGLRKAMKAKNYDRFTKRVLDRKALEDAMERDEVDSRLVAQYCTPKVGTPFLKVTTKEVEEK